MRESGVKITIDDFGGGYSNFYILTYIKLDCLKIDGSLVSRIVDDDRSADLVKVIVDMSRHLNAGLIAEFVLDERILSKVEGMGIRYVQGLLF